MFIAEKAIMFSTVSDCLFVCKQDYSQTTDVIFFKLNFMARLDIIQSSNVV